MRIYIKEHGMDMMDLYGTAPRIGDLVTLVERINVNTNETTWNFASADGAPGNSDPSIRRYHGWRGTTNNSSATARGLRRVEKIQRFKNGNYAITLSEDLKPDEE